MDDLVDQILALTQEEIRSRIVAVAEDMKNYVVKYYQSKGHVITRALINSVTYYIDADGLGFKIVVPVFYAAFLEFGTVHQPARYPLRIAVHQNFQNSLEILAGNK